MSASSKDLARAGANGDLLAESLTLAVPLWMAKFDTRAKAAATEDCPYDRLVYRYGTELVEGAASPHPAGDGPALISTTGDTLMGRATRPGSGAVLFNALARGLAAMALIEPDGVAYAGKHWCRTGQCSHCQGRESHGED